MSVRYSFSSAAADEKSDHIHVEWLLTDQADRRSRPPTWYAHRVQGQVGGFAMARKYARSAAKDVEREMHKFKRGTLKSGKGGKGGAVKSRRQAIATGLSEARREGKRVPSGPG